MPWFSKRPKTLVPADVLIQLSSFGSAKWEALKNSRPIDDPRFGGYDFFARALKPYLSDSARTVGELHSAAAADPLARYGAYGLIAEVAPGCSDPLYLDLMDAALQMMFAARLSSGHMTGYEAQRWIATHGDLRTSFDRLVPVTPPPPGAVSLDLARGDTMKVAVMGPGDLDNQFWIERTKASTYRAFSMRRKDSDATRLTRYEEQLIGESDSVEGLLLALGRYLREPTYWAIEDLDPYFTEGSVS